ncbi:thioredoxin domain-containing protein [Gramella jeungdoensis]|uniref:Thioredoxin domain-containing protein n=1 Tax=Gramella jeungdoensis TaxID=708091 RepID=A0ABT0Z0M9_9FLAO|nr:thioredoxin domain-containing protein [Gramella jeungdoensis]MCM8568815.1 thioredoxin domain-containing protein [Gramella jeungdoensis]
MNKEKPKYTNELIKESSPYLLQHAHNPVNWKAWNDKSLELAREERQLLLISVGYSACHWCHVMEHESFEDEEVAAVMNSNYICIKVDREERPDVDQVYMNAVQVMTGMGGWPMNVVALPDGRPVWGGTYFRKGQWKNALEQIAHLYQTQPEKLEEYATKLETGLKQIQIIEPASHEDDFHSDFFIPLLEKWQRSFDLKNGGPKRAPKFMMPNNYEFLLRYAFQNSDDKIMDHCIHTLNKISWGGVFDPIEGGFSRYSVDEKWHVPHFEKMLYDNAQLVQLYSKAYKITKDEWFREVVEITLDFIESEMTDPSGAFYSALDADSENENGVNEEGAYYIWTKEELKSMLPEDFELFVDFYNINNHGRWESNKYVLIRTGTLEEIADRHNRSVEDLNKKRETWRKKLLAARKKRKKPGLDDKSLTSWNAMMISGYTESFKAFHQKKHLEAAKRNAEFILKNQFQENGRLLHTYKNGRSSINGYLEDYAFTIEAFLNLYEATFDTGFLENCQKLMEIVFEDFQDTESGLFFFTSNKDRKLITKTIEISDNVIPASNSVIAKNLLKLGKLIGNPDYIEKSQEMLHTLKEKIPEHPQYHSNWLDLMLNFTHPFYEIAVTGEKYREITNYFQERYLPNTVLAATNSSSDLSLLKDRFVKDKDLIYICEEGTCQLPVSSKSEAMQLISQV